MKKQIASILTAALLTFTFSTGVVMAETAEEATATTTETSVKDKAADDATTDDTAVEDASAEDTTTEGTDTTVAETSEVTSDSDTTDTEEEDPPVVNPDGEEVDPGTLPDSPLYWLESFIEKIQVALTFDPIKKAEKLEHHACEKLAEAAKLAQKGDETHVHKALTLYTEKIGKAQEFLEEVQDSESEKSQQLQTALANVSQNNIEVLQGLLEKLPPKAAEKLAINIVRTMEKAVKKVDMLAEKEAEKAEQEVADSTEDSTQTEDAEGTIEETDTDGDGELTTNPATETDTDTEEATDPEKESQLTKEEYKALSKEAKEALAEFQAALGVEKDSKKNCFAYLRSNAKYGKGFYNSHGMNFFAMIPPVNYGIYGSFAPVPAVKNDQPVNNAEGSKDSDQKSDYSAEKNQTNNQYVSTDTKKTTAGQKSSSSINKNQPQYQNPAEKKVGSDQRQESAKIVQQVKTLPAPYAETKNNFSGSKNNYSSLQKNSWNNNQSKNDRDDGRKDNDRGYQR